MNGSTLVIFGEPIPRIYPLGSIFVTMNWEPIFVSWNDWIKVVLQTSTLPEDYNNLAQIHQCWSLDNVCTQVQMAEIITQIQTHTLSVPQEHR